MLSSYCKIEITMNIKFFPGTKVAKVSDIATPEEAALLHEYAVKYKLEGRKPEIDYSSFDAQDFGRGEYNSGEENKEETRNFWSDLNVYFKNMPSEYIDIQQKIKDRAIEAFNLYLKEVGDPRTQYDPYDVSPEAIHVYRAGYSLSSHEDCHDYALVIYLTDPTTYGGGELHYFDPSNLFYKPELGYMVIAPSELVHEVLPITSGFRCSMTTFFPVAIPGELPEPELAA